MIIPCIDLQDGKAVQLIKGQHKVIEVNDIDGLLEKFAPFPLIHVIDLDAAKGAGSNDALAADIVSGRACRVGGGIRNVERASQILELGARQVIVGTAAFAGDQPNVDFLQDLVDACGRDKICIALDSHRGKIVVRGWQESLALEADIIIQQLEPYCSSFLCTYVDNEGSMQGSNFEWFKQLSQMTSNQIIGAGGFASLDELSTATALGIDVAIGMAVYTGALKLEDLLVMKETPTC